MPELRSMRDADVAAVHELSLAAFEDLARRRQRAIPPRLDPAFAHVRIRRVLEADPAGSWVSERVGGGLDGAALAIRREGLWGLSLLVVHPETQSAGAGSALLRRTLDYADGARAGVILASPDARALRAYTRAGFTFHPCAEAAGVPRGVVAAPEVRAFRPGDHALAATVDRAVRGAARGGDLDALVAADCELLTFPERGYAAQRGGSPRLVAALDDAAAAALLRTVLARAPAGAEVEVLWLTGAQQWAIDVAVDAGLELRVCGGVFLRGDVGSFRPYLPNGHYL
jgi:GNAT superfamily N-acetyltransferase